jgi:hypothetical protein
MQACSSNCTNSSYIPGIFSTSCCQTNNCNSIKTKAIVSSCYMGLSFTSSLFGTAQLLPILIKNCSSGNDQYCASISANSSVFKSRLNAYLCLSICKSENINGISVSCCQGANCNAPSKSPESRVSIQLLIIVFSLFYFI